MSEKVVMREVTVYHCDICGKEIDEDEMDCTNQCVKCGKDICLKHTGDTSDDGGLCTKCSERYEFDSDDHLVSKKTGRPVSAKLI